MTGTSRNWYIYIYNISLARNLWPLGSLTPWSTRLAEQVGLSPRAHHSLNSHASHPRKRKRERERERERHVYMYTPMKIHLYTSAAIEKPRVPVPINMYIICTHLSLRDENLVNDFLHQLRAHAPERQVAVGRHWVAQPHHCTDDVAHRALGPGAHHALFTVPNLPTYADRAMGVQIYICLQIYIYLYIYLLCSGP